MRRALLTLITLSALPWGAHGAEPTQVAQTRAMRADLDARGAGWEAPGDMLPALDDAQRARLETGVGGYIAVALEHSALVRASFERWESAVHRVARAHAFPEPMLSLAVFAQSVETRVGPQQAKVGLSQTFPWPTTLIAGTDAASMQARAAQQQFETVALWVSGEVAKAYWSLWELRVNLVTHRRHLGVLDGMSSTVRARLEVGKATLADLQQIDLSRARLADSIETLRAAEHRAEAGLAALLGFRTVDALPTSIDGPTPAMPDEAEQALVAAAVEHPMVRSVAFRAEAADAMKRVAAAKRAPTFTLGVDWLITGPAVMPNVADSGKDAVAVGLGIKLPLWQGQYGRDVAAARADAEALRADERGLADQAVASLRQALSKVQDSARRVDVSRDTLLPQAEAAYGSLLGAYTTGNGSVAQVLLAQRDLLELRVSVDAANADHARAWAELEQVVGRPVRRQAAPPMPVETSP